MISLSERPINWRRLDLGLNLELMFIPLHIRPPITRFGTSSNLTSTAPEMPYSPARFNNVPDLECTTVSDDRYCSAIRRNGKRTNTWARAKT